MLKVVVDSLDDVDEAHRDMYEEKDGKFYLRLEGVDNHYSVAGLKSTVAALRKDKKTLGDKIAELSPLADRARELPENFDLTEHQRLVAEEERRKKDPNYKPGGDPEHVQRITQQHQQQIANLNRTHAEALAAKDQEISDLDATVRKVVGEDTLTQALVEVGVEPHFMEGARAMLLRSVKVVRDEENGERRAVVDTDIGEVPVKQYVETWAKSDSGKVYVKPATGGGGGGGRPPKTTETNPWMREPKGNYNLTRQGEIVKADREKARRLMAAAKIPQHEIDATLGPRQAAA